MKWDETIKDKLKTYESSLPEGGLDDFMARLDESRAKLDESRVPSGRRRIAPVVWVSVPAFAAALTAVLLVSHHGPGIGTGVESQQYVSENGSAAEQVDIVEQTAPVQIPADPVKTPDYVAQTVKKPKPQLQQQPQPQPQQQPEPQPENTDMPVIESEPQPEVTDMPVMVVNDNTAAYAGNTDPVSADRAHRPIVPQTLEPVPFPDDEPVRQTPEFKFKALPTMAGALGCGLLAAVLPVATAVTDSKTERTLYVKTDSYNYKAHVSSSSKDYTESHNRPVKAGLSLRVPFSERFSVVSGVDYSLYNSNINNAEQKVQYLGIPARLDWAIVPNRRIGIYIGAGASADFCIAAQQKGESVKKDGITFSLLAAGGAQYNITKSVSLFLEPTLSWRIPSSNTALQTYRSSHPLMFSLSTGLRYTLSGNRKRTALL